MGDKYGGGAGGQDLLHFGFAFLAEGAVADGQNLVQNEDIRLDKAGDRKRKA